MAKFSPESLLKDKRVIDEINRHLWIESEKAGIDIGFEQAAQDWIKRCSSEWLKYNKLSSVRINRIVNTKTKKRRTRRAKSYI